MLCVRFLIAKCSFAVDKVVIKERYYHYYYYNYYNNSRLPDKYAVGKPVF